MAPSIRAEKPQAKQQSRWKQPHPSVNTCSLKTPRHTAASNLTQRQNPTHQRDRNQPHLPVGRNQSLLPGSLWQSPVPTSATTRTDITSKSGYNAIVCKKVTTPKTYTQEKTENYNSDEGKRKKSPKKSAKWSGDSQPLGKRL